MTRYNSKLLRIIHEKYQQRDRIFMLFLCKDPGDICPPFATSFIAFVVCIVERLRMSNKHLCKINNADINAALRIKLLVKIWPEWAVSLDSEKRLFFFKSGESKSNFLFYENVRFCNFFIK